MTTANESTRDPCCAELVGEVAEQQIESIRLLLCPTENDVTLGDDGTLDTVLILGDSEHRYSQDFASAYRDEETGELDLAKIVSDNWWEIQEEAYERFHDLGLSFDWIGGDDGESGYFCYLISTGGPGTEIRFFVNPSFALYRAEFWYLDWFDGACSVVTADSTIEALWEMLRECSAEHVYKAATE